jgi:hypothetical protein
LPSHATLFKAKPALRLWIKMGITANVVASI